MGARGWGQVWKLEIWGGSRDSERIENGDGKYTRHSRYDEEARLTDVWNVAGGDLYEALERLDRDGCARYVVTDVERDGTLTGPKLELLKSVCAATDRPVIASGGISSLADIEALVSLRPVGVEGAIVGKALYAGAFTFPQALAVTRK